MNKRIKILLILICSSLIYPYCVTFQLNIESLENPSGNWVPLVNGSWNNWSGWGQTLYDDDGDGIFSGTKCGLTNGDYEYVYAISGDFDNWSGWGEVGNAPVGSSCDYNPLDSYYNYGFNISNADKVLDVNGWNCCGVNNCLDWQGCEVGGMQTKDEYLYGRFEVRMKSADGDGIVSSFFTYNTNWDSDLGNLNWNEIDIEMTGNRDSSVQFTTHHPGSPNSWSFGEIIEVDFNPHNTFHDYAFEWTPNYVKWFVDGLEVYEQGLSIVDDLDKYQKIMMNIWPAIYTDWVGEWDPSHVPKHSYYDYVKYYSYVPGEGNYGTDNDFLLDWIDDFDNFNSSIWNDDSNGSFNGNYCSFTPLNTNFYNGYLILSLSDINDPLVCNEVDGDINEDELLNVLDLVIMVDIILQDSAVDLEICHTLAIDSNSDESLNVLDLVYFISIIIST